jgi:urease accessory protein UreF
MSVESGDGFDRWLEQQLQTQAVNQRGPSPMPAQAQYHAAYLQGGPHMSVLAKAATVVSTKGAIGLAVAALAIGTAGVAAEAAITGSANPSNWGQQVVQQVDKCKAALAPGSHGIGECVSTFASKHGQEESSEHRASPARLHTPGAPTDHPTGPPTNHPGGKPSGTPGQS